MKVISILQPWASLIVIGHKRIETRSWNTKYRGPILIHASAGKKDYHRTLLLDWHQEFDLRGIPNYRELPFGAIIGQAELVNVVDSKYCFEGNEFEWNSMNKNHKFAITHQELTFGDYSENRFGWMLDNAERFPDPIPAKGKLGIWDFDNPVVPELTKIG